MATVQAFGLRVHSICKRTRCRGRGLGFRVRAVRDMFEWKGHNFERIGEEDSTSRGRKVSLDVM